MVLSEKERLKRTINWLIEQVEDLQARMQKIDGAKAPESEEKPRWRAEENGKYFTVMPSGVVRTFWDGRDQISDLNWGAGNYFATKEEAEEFATKFKQLLSENIQ